MSQNTLYYGDNLDILRRYVAPESVDLVYLDPPFNSNQDYNVLFAEKNGSQAASQIKAFEDTWRWDQSAALAYQELVEQGSRPAQVMMAFRTFLGESDMLAYLAMMAPRLVELRRVLKPTGSIYLHCDPTASHYLKLLMDAVFGPEHFRNEITWKRTSGRKSIRQFGRIHDIILFYSKSLKNTWASPVVEQDEENVRGHDLVRDENGILWRVSDLSGAGEGPSRNFSGKSIHPPKGRHWQFDQQGINKLIKNGRIVISSGGKPRLRTAVEDLSGKSVNDLWTDIEPINASAAERLGYPTQKPLALLERILAASSNEGDVVLDPFCGCGTAVVAAQKMNRQWIGIDITHLAVTLIKHRLKDSFGVNAAYRVVGEPVSLPDAEALAKADPYQFQWWALGLVGARPVEQKKGADRGIDGRIYFHDDAKGKTKQVLISVKAGSTGVAHVRDLRGVLEREEAEIGALLTMKDPTEPMRREAAAAGFYDSPGWGKKFPRLQILTIAELLDGRTLAHPPQTGTFKRAKMVKPEGNGTEDLF